MDVEVYGWAWMLVGVVLGLGAGGVLWWADMRLYRRWLEQCPVDGLPREVNGRMYHVVPAERYVKMLFVFERVALVGQAKRAKDEAYGEEMSRRDREARFGGIPDHDRTPWGEKIGPGA